MLLDKSSLKFNISGIITIVRRGFCGFFFGGGQAGTHSKPSDYEKEGVKKGEKEKRGSSEKPVFPC